MVFSLGLGQLVGIAILAISVSCCSNLTTVTLTLKPQNVQVESCNRHPEYPEFGIKKIAVLNFIDCEQKETTRFIPDPKFRLRSYDNIVNFPENGAHASFLAEKILLESYQYDVIERRQLEPILSEHHLTLSGLIDGSEAKKLGHFVGVDAILFGRVLEAYANFDANTKGDGSFIGTYIAHVAVEMRLIHVETGRILFACTMQRNSLNYLDRPITVTNHDIIKNPRMLQEPLHGTDGIQRVKYIMERAIKESLTALL